MRALLLPLLAAASVRAAPFELRDGDRVALLGTTVMERDQRTGAIETTLTLAASDKHLTFRNLGWSGDTVFGDARSYFGPAKDGLARLRTQLDLVKPSVVLACYGAELAFAEDLSKNLPEFLAGYRAWLDLVREAGGNPRVALLPPPPLENLPGRPNQDAANKQLLTLREAIQTLAKERDIGFLDTHARIALRKSAGPLTQDGLNYGSSGQEAWAQAIAAELGLSKPPVADAAVRALVVKKDSFFFNRHRPANETYLFLFRKHEQGRNGAEIPQFDPLIADLDTQIHQTKLGLLTPGK